MGRGGVAGAGAEPLRPPRASAAEDRGPQQVPSSPANRTCSRHPARLGGTGDAVRRLGSGGGVAWPWREAPWVPRISPATEKVVSAPHPGADLRGVLPQGRAREQGMLPTSAAESGC